ncbi:taste receptor type 2 member 3 [Ochotona curzoniae]|uniref:taste receptor type 2 member 3 n=1 Tax=Ochotona curzoniae TaxID=130825 RepID=UPI001B352DE3|nr:taste receptor type 2 member 3 [Ochotona curzoniae]
MLGFSEWLSLVLSVTQFVVGILGNSFIGLVNGSSWFKNRRISMSDFLITNLALSRIVLLWIFFIDGLLIVFSYSTHDSGIMMQIVDIFWTFINQLSIWLATCLHVLYCLKIATFPQAVFLWLKWRVSRVVGWMLLGALLFACGSTMSLINEFKIYSVLNEIGDSENMTEVAQKKKGEYEVMHVLMSLWYSPALFLSLTACALLILSLGRHTRQMQQNGVTSSDQSSKAHKKAIRLIFSFLFLFLLYFLAFLILSSSYFLPGTKKVKMVGEIITMSSPTVHSFILILWNNKLKQAFMEMLRCESCHLKCGSKVCCFP